MVRLSPIHIILPFAWLSLVPIICTQSFNLDHQPATRRRNMQLMQQEQNNRKQHLIRNNHQSRNMLSTSILHMSSSVDENIDIDAKEIENNNNNNNIQPDNSIREKIIQEKVELINELNDPMETQSTKLNELIEEDQSAVDEIINEVEIINENDDDDDILIIIDDDDSSNLILAVPSLSKQYTTNNTTSLLSSERSKRTRRKRKKNNPRMQMFAYLSQPIVEVQVIGLVFLSCFLQAINTLDDLPSTVHRGIDAVDTVCVYLFAVEFFLRWWSAGRFQLRYLAKPLASIDAIVVILPLILSGVLPVLYDFGVTIPAWLLSSAGSSALLNLRFLRVLKFQRVLTNQRTYTEFMKALGMMKKTDVRPYQLQLARVIITIFTLVSVSTGLIYTAEHEVNHQIPDYFTALYFGLTTLTTVGYGDISPVTSQGRLVVSLTILAGVAIIPAQAASLAEAYIDFQNEQALDKSSKATKRKKKQRKCGKCNAGPQRSDALYCWSCGELLD